MQVRTANKDDVRAIHGFICALEDEAFDPVLFREYYLQNINAPSNIYLVATDNDRPVAYISCHGQVLLHHLGLVYEIQELFVQPGYRGKGIGKLLLKALEEKISEQPYELLEVASNMRRKEAHGFYLNNGFECTSYKFKKIPGK